MTLEAASVVTMMHRAWREPGVAGRLAIVSGSDRLDYRQLAERVGSLAGSLRAAGIGRQDRIALAMDRSPELVLALLAGLVAGACVCVLEPRLGPDETRRRFAMTRLGWLVADAANAGDPALADLPGVRRIRFERLPAGDAFWDLDIAPEDPAMLLFTSGSSGKPKGVLQSHRGLVTNATGVIAHTGLRPADRLLHVMPLHHTNGVNNQIIAPLLAGATVILADRFKAEEMPRLMALHQPTIITGVPTMYSRLLACELSEQALRSLRIARCGSAPITEELHRRVEAKIGKPLIVSYGLSEATCTSTMNPPAARRIGSVGTVLPGQEIQLRARDGTIIEGPRREGEICIAGPSLMLGYIDEQSGGRSRFDGDVLHTGDLGWFDEDGYLFISGRIKEVIIRGGENLSPALIEGALAAVPGVQACCVVGKPDPDLGEVPLAFIVRAPGASGDGLDEEQLGEAVARSLSRSHRPAAYRFIDALPENTVGKVDRKALAARIA